MLFNSAQFLVFFPIVVALYYAIPDRVKHLWLLAASYYFYMCWNAKYALLMLFSTVVTYTGGRLLEAAGRSDAPPAVRARRKKWCVAASFVLNLGVLFTFKYLDFALSGLNALLGVLHVRLTVPVFDFLLPVGISFYTFQALGYTVDVYRGDTCAEKDFFRYALFVSFFPQLVAGPIERSKNLLRQLAAPKRFDSEAVRDGLLLMLWGYFLKLVLADRIALFVDTVYAGAGELYEGWELILATVLFAVQIYCDFYGYSVIAMGAAEILGIRLMENFNAPYLSTSVAQFWKNWHISLTSWFRDYLYIPLGGNRRGRLRKSLNCMAVFLVSGLWHGASLTFVVWGGLNGLYQVIGEWTAPLRDALVRRLGLHRESWTHRLVQRLVTFGLVDLAWVFFRADSLGTALRVLRGFFHDINPARIWDGTMYACGLDAANFWLMWLCIGVLLFADICKRKGICLRRHIAAQDGWARAGVIVFAVCFILVFGIWGTEYNAASFIYFQF